MSESRFEEHSPGWRTRIRALGFVVGVIVFMFAEALFVLVISGQFVIVIIDPLLGQIHPVFREPLDPFLASKSSSRAIPGTIRGWTLAGCRLLLLYGWGYVRRNVVTWPYDKLPSSEFRAKLGAPSEKPSKPMAGWKAVIFLIVELILAFVVALPVAALVLDPLIGDWSVIFWVLAPVGWLVLRWVVALVRGRGPWPYAEKPNDLLYHLTESFQQVGSDDDGNAETPRQ